MTEVADHRAQARAVWSAGDYPSIARDYLNPVGERVVAAVGIGPGDDVLDVACGAGNATVKAAKTGATVTGLDITPELFDAAREEAEREGVEIELVEGDAQELPFADESFDVVISVFGCMFAPDQKKAAAEIARVLRPGGRMAVAAWDPEGGIGDFFKVVAKHMPPPPEDFVPPVMWGDRDHVSGLFEGTGMLLRFEDDVLVFPYEDAESSTERYEREFGPVVMAKRALEPEGKWQPLRDDMVELFERRAGEDGSVNYEGEYLIALGEKEGAPGR